MTRKKYIQSGSRVIAQVQINAEPTEIFAIVVTHKKVPASQLVKRIRVVYYSLKNFIDNKRLDICDNCDGKGMVENITGNFGRGIGMPSFSGKDYRRCHKCCGSGTNQFLTNNDSKQF